MSDPLIEAMVRRIVEQHDREQRRAASDSDFGNFRILGGIRARPAGPVDHSSTTYVDLGGTDLTLRAFTKYLAGTDLLILFSVDGFMTVAASVFEVGVRLRSPVITDADYEANARWPINVLNNHQNAVDYIPLAGLPAGDYEAKLRIKRISSTGTLRCDSNSVLAFLVLECPSEFAYG